MLGVDGPTVCANVRAKAAMFSVLLAALMTWPAQGLQLTKPERIPVTTMRLDVVGDHRSLDQTLLQTVLAQRVLTHLATGACLPTAETVPVARVGRMQHEALFSL